MNLASEARSNFTQRIDEAYEEVLSGIREVSKAGKLEFVPRYYPDSISDAIVARLRRDGFSVEWFTDRSPNHGELRWRMTVKWWSGATFWFWFWIIVPFALATSPITFVTLVALWRGE